MRMCNLLIVAVVSLTSVACNRTPSVAEPREEPESPPVKVAADMTPRANPEEARFHKYRDELEKNITALDVQIEKLEASASSAAVESKAAIYQHIAHLYAQRDDVYDRMKELRRTGSEKLHAIKPTLDDAVGKLQSTLKTAQSTVEKALDQAKEQAAFSKTQQEFQQYQLKVQKTVEDLDQKIDSLLNQANKATKEAKTELFNQVATVYKQREAVRLRLNELRDSSMDGWQELRTGVDRAIQELGDAVTRASEKFKS